MLIYNLKKINSGSNKITITDDIGNSEVDIDADANNIVAASNDSRLSDARTPTAHTHTLSNITDAGSIAARNTVSGADINSITESKITFTDITTNNVTTSLHGFVPKAPNNTTQFLRGDATWAVPTPQFNTMRMTGSTAIGTTTLTSLPGLGFAVAANTDYAFEFSLMFKTSHSGVGIRIDVSGPASPTNVAWLRTTTLLATSGTNSLETNSRNTYAGDNATASIGSGGLNYMAFINGILQNGANSGSLFLVAASELNNAGSIVTIQKGSWGIWF